MGNREKVENGRHWSPWMEIWERKRIMTYKLELFVATPSTIQKSLRFVLALISSHFVVCFCGEICRVRFSLMVGIVGFVVFWVVMWTPCQTSIDVIVEFIGGYSGFVTLSSPCLIHFVTITFTKLYYYFGRYRI